MIIIYRACSTGNPEKKRPIQDKYELVSTCFASFKQAFKNTQHTLVVLLDKPTPQFRDIFKGEKMEETFYSTFDEGNIQSFHRQIEIALEAKQPFLFVEDDYYFLPSAGAYIEAFTASQTGFYTPYDHPDYYRDERHVYDRTIALAGCHWGTVSATTLTFGGDYESLLKEHETMKRYGWADYPMWCDITKRVPLYAPIPTLATHMENDHLAPLFDTLKTLP